MRNTNKSIAEALNTLVEIKNICQQKGKKLVTYISMGFGNPYNDPYDKAMVSQFVDVLLTLGSDIISIADTIGSAQPQDVKDLFATLSKAYPSAELGVHLHSNPASAAEKIAAAYSSGCKRFDGALKGFGGCPMAKDELVGNIATEEIISFLKSKGEKLSINEQALNESLHMASQIFPNH
jgi:hydroxymethylglutaryl-CoA lyase